MTAPCLLEDTASLRPGARLLVNGAAGAQGTATVQIGERLGAHVTAVASAADADFLTALGADAVLDYGAIDFATLGERWTSSTTRSAHAASRMSASRSRRAGATCRAC